MFCIMILDPQTQLESLKYLISNEVQKIDGSLLEAIWDYFGCNMGDLIDVERSEEAFGH